MKVVSAAIPESTYNIIKKIANTEKRSLSYYVRKVVVEVYDDD